MKPQPGNHRQNSPCERHYIAVAIVYTSLYAMARKHRLWSVKLRGSSPAAIRQVLITKSKPDQTSPKP